MVVRQFLNFQFIVQSARSLPVFMLAILDINFVTGSLSKVPLTNFGKETILIAVKFKVGLKSK